MIKGKRIVVVIPARGGSTGLPGKNTRLFNGRPMITHSIGKALSLEGVDRVIVSTDDPEIARISRDYGAEVPFMRGAHLAEDHTPMVPVILDAIRQITEKDDAFDYALMLQANSPLTLREDIQRVIDKIIDEQLDVVFTVTAASHPPQWTIRLDNGRPVLAFMSSGEKAGNRRQDQETLYRSTGAIYAVSIPFLLLAAERVRLCLPAEHQRTGVVVTDKYSSSDIDDELDLYLAETIVSRKPELA